MSNQLEHCALHSGFGFVEVGQMLVDLLSDQMKHVALNFLDRAGGLRFVWVNRSVLPSLHHLPRPIGFSARLELLDLLARGLQDRADVFQFLKLIGRDICDIRS